MSRHLPHKKSQNLLHLHFLTCVKKKIPPYFLYRQFGRGPTVLLASAEIRWLPTIHIRRNKIWKRSVCLAPVKSFSTGKQILVEILRAKYSLDAVTNSGKIFDIYMQMNVTNQTRERGGFPNPNRCTEWYIQLKNK
ncbi:hypothetical protein CEXT_292591 [Caerostris extrusa]|uniref:LAGLIDADG homing endonuclease n=1 Tax=Caerostris extrusa TaxID=172846 RepID=A0AAV4W7D5_CAEEX|nr:hypothetical protein CEXT_292591 [Caerostris extrusa]